MMSPFQKRLMVGIVIMALLSPLGILLPKIFGAGEAWGEWSVDQIERLIGYVPEGMKRIAWLWKAPIRDYNFGAEDSPVTARIFYYIISGFLGIIIAAGIIYLITRMLLKNEKR